MSDPVDHLTHDERLRLEALNQANARHAARPGLASADAAVIKTAATFEQYVRNGETNE